MMLKTSNIESLPEDIIFNILVRVSAQDICSAAIFVCRTWRQMIRTRVFVHAQQSTHGILIPKDGSRSIFLATRKDQIEASNINYEFTSRVLSSCNGLVLEYSGDNNRCDVCITNPSTKQHFALPSFSCLYAKLCECCSIAYAAAVMEYKVVRIIYSHIPRKVECAILTVGVDMDWGRRVNIQHLTLEKKFLYFQRTLTTEGFVHWTHRGCSDFLSLNVETEAITKFSVPAAAASCHDDGSRFKYYYNYLTMGSNLCLLIALSDWSWEVWEMRPETGEWTQMPNIDIEPHQSLALSKLKDLGSSGCQIEPVAWLSFREVLVVCVHPDTSDSKYYISYNVCTQEIELDLIMDTYFLAHKNTLLWL